MVERLRAMLAHRQHLIGGVMAVRMTGTWIPVAEIGQWLRGNLGVFQFADAQHNIVFIGFAGGRSPFGLKSEVDQALTSLAAASGVETAGDAAEIASVRFEVTTAYHTRYRELLMAFVADHGRLPLLNSALLADGKLDITLGRLSPA